MYPTFAYIEDEFERKPAHLSLCGFDDLIEDLQQTCNSEFGVSATLLRSRFGPATGVNAGLLGYLEGIVE
jgi:hypothetical protein